MSRSGRSTSAVWCWLSALVIACGHFGVLAQQAEVKNGNVYYVAPGGKERQITSLAADSDAALSPDGKAIIFVRTTAKFAGFEEPRDSHPLRTEIWIARVDQSSKPRAIFAGIVQAWNFRYACFSAPHIAPDNHHAYFLIMFSATEDAIVRLDMETGAVNVITTGGPYFVVANGKYEGDLVVQKRKQASEGFSQFYWLVSPDGKELGLVGHSESEVQTFLKNPDREIQQ